MSCDLFSSGWWSFPAILPAEKEFEAANMHPVLKTEIETLANEISALSKEDAQVHPLPGNGRWSAQEIIEHLILSQNLTSETITAQLTKGTSPKNRRNLLKFFLRLQTIGAGYMPYGVPSMLAVRPRKYTAESGPAIAARFLESAETMDRLLVAARNKFGIQTCGEHPFYGVMRVDEWRRYHAIHARHHLAQLRNAIKYSQSVKEDGVLAS
jgi:hypothetical protein